MKIANWNIERMNDWFVGDRGAPALRPSHEIRGGVSDVDALAGRVARVITAIDPDVLTVQEGPSRKEEMQLFVDRFLDGGFGVLGPSGSGAQKLFTLVKRGGAVADAREITPDGEIRFDRPFEVDIDGDGEVAPYEFTRLPLVVDVRRQADGRHVRIVNLHLKSKYVHLGERLWSDPQTRPDFIREALLARRRISAEAMRVRQYLTEVLIADIAHPVVVCGDLNDGPGSDHFERHYLTHNLVAAIAGNPFVPQVMFRHGFIDKVDAEDNYTAIFDDFVDRIPQRRILLDHILASPGLYWDLTDGRIEHPAFDAQIDHTAARRQRLPSDHRPQSITF